MAPSSRARPAMPDHRGWSRLRPPDTMPTTPTDGPSRRIAYSASTTPSASSDPCASVSCSHPSMTTRTSGAATEPGGEDRRVSISPRRWSSRPGNPRWWVGPTWVPRCGRCSRSASAPTGSMRCTCRRCGGRRPARPRTSVRRAVVRPLPGRPDSSQVPSAGVQSRGETRWSSGSSSSPTATLIVASSSGIGGAMGGSRRLGRGGSHGGRGCGPPSARWAAHTAATAGRDGGHAVVARHGIRRDRGQRPRARLAHGEVRCRVGRTAAHGGGLEHHERPVATAAQRSPRCARADAGRGRVLEDVDGVGPVPHAEGDPQVDVGLDLGGDRAGGPLRREDEVDTEGAAESREAHQAAHEVGHLVDQRLQLVDHDDQARHALGTRGLDPAVALEVARTRCREDALAPTQLGAEGAQGPGHEVLVEVGDQPDDVGQGRTGPEGGTALEVDQHERQLVGRARDREGGDEGAQELGLARPRRSAHEDVRAVADEVDREGTVGCHADHGLGGRRSPGPAAPPGCDLRRRDVGEAVRLRERDRLREAAGDAVAGPQRGQRPRDALGPPLPDEVEAQHAARGRACRLEDVSAIRTRRDHGGDAARHVRAVGGGDDHVRPGIQRSGDERRGCAVDVRRRRHDEDPVAGGAVTRHLRREEVGEVGGVGQEPDPGPRGVGVRDGERQAVRGLAGAELTDEHAKVARRHVRRPDHRQPTDLGEVHHHGGITDLRVGAVRAVDPDHPGRHLARAQAEQEPPPPSPPPAAQRPGSARSTVVSTRWGSGWA